MKSTLSILAVLFLAGSVFAEDAKPTRQGLDYFEAKIRPMLVKHCYQCHSSGAAAKKNLQAGLFLDSREGVLKGGESGPSLVPGKPEESLLMDALRHDGLKMPPKSKLPDEIIAHFEKWIKMGAPDPRDGSVGPVKSGVDIAAGKQHWAFQPLKQIPPPAAADAKWTRTPVDQFIRVRQETVKVQPNPTADARTLVRRAYFDLIGLPPTPEQVTQFLTAAETDLDAAYRSLIDELLASDHYGERWSRHWLDLARFAESNGYAFDKDRANAWRYRDFVIRALNEDMPYDEFVRWQIAGDLLANSNPQTKAEAELALRQHAATGFLVAGPFTTQQTQKERERSRYEQLDDMIHTMGTGLLGLTIGCCRCHDHKYDPLPQFDYYALASCFSEVGFADTGINLNPEEFRKKKAAYDAEVTPLVKARTDHENGELTSRFDAWLQSRPTAEPVAKGGVKYGVWQHVGPFPAADQNAAFNTQFPPEKDIDLKASYLEGKLKWAAKPEWVDGTVHNTLTGDNSANYLYRVVEAADAQQVNLSLGRDDAIKLWVNGQEVLAKNVAGAAAADQELVSVKLNKGKNDLLLKIVNGGGPSGFYFSGGATTAPIEMPVLTDWHQIGPFIGTDFNSAFDHVFAPEKNVDLSQSFANGMIKWTAQPTWKDGQAHNDKLSGQNNSANYLYRTIEAKQPTDLALWLGSDDGIKVWLNGRELLAKKVTRNNAAANQEKLTIKVPQGKSELLVKIVNAKNKTGFYFQANTQAPPKDVIGFLKLDAKKWNAGQRKKVVDWYKGFDRDWLYLNDAVVAKQKNEPKADMATAYAARKRGSTYQFGGDTYKVYHLRRGNPDNKQDVAKPGLLQVLISTEGETVPWLDDMNESKTPSRIALADWLSDTEHGAGDLLARVIVNRLWHHHFGRGLVSTPSDFGLRGERPTHPQLLDWLANELINNGWKLKPIHKLIMTSSVYMQANGESATGLQNDPENLLLWRRQSRRLEAEVIRDALLSVSGQLDRSLYGKGNLNQNSLRRSVYFTVKRSQLIPMLQLFDAPDAMQGVGDRQESTVAPQALVMMNSPQVRAFALKFSQQVKPNNETTIEQAVTTAHQLAFGRAPTAEELSRMTTFIKARGSQGEALALRDVCHVLLCANEFLYVD